MIQQVQVRQGSWEGLWQVERVVVSLPMLWQVVAVVAVVQVRLL
jgi:hypothetical protein